MLGALDIVGLDVGKAAVNVIGSLMRSTAHLF